MLTERTANEMLELLTPKHREVLDLINEHNSNKEVARRLRVAPTTVEYRLKSVRKLWNTDNRNATMRLYNELLTARDAPQGDLEVRAVSAVLQLSGPHLSPSQTGRPGASETSTDLRSQVKGDPSVHVFRLENFDASFGIAGRAVLILLIAFVIVMIGAGTLFIAQTLSRIG